jgi:hypothetical protein
MLGALRNRPVHGGQLFILVAVAALLVSIPAGHAVADPVADHGIAARPPGGPITIEKLKANGSGCRPDTTAIDVSPDEEAFSISYSTYIAFAGNGSKPKDQRKDCGITIRLNVPQHWTYAIASVDYRGYAQLDRNASTVLDVRYKFQGHGPQTTRQHPFATVMADNWQVTDVIRGEDRVFGPCGRDRKFDIDTELRIDAPNGPNTPISFIAMDTTDGEFSSTYRLAWKKC